MANTYHSVMTGSTALQILDWSALGSQFIIIRISRSSAKAPQRNTYKPQNVHQISKNEMKTQGHSRQV